MGDWKSTDFITALRASSAPEADVAFFKSVAWTSQLLDDPKYETIRWPSREPKTPSTEDELLSGTLNTKRTIANTLVLIRKTLLTGPVKSGAHSSESPKPSGEALSDPEVIVLLDLGAGLCGFRDTLHGGIACTLLDESLGVCVELHRHRRTLHAMGQSNDLTELYTAYLNMSYRRTVTLPAVVMIKCCLERTEGRKWYLKGQLCDAEGQVCTEAEGLWVAARSQKM